MESNERCIINGKTKKKSPLKMTRDITHTRNLVGRISISITIRGQTEAKNPKKIIEKKRN